MGGKMKKRCEKEGKKAQTDIYTSVKKMRNKLFHKTCSTKYPGS